MTGIPKTGTSNEVTFVVEPQHTIEFAGDGMPPVLSTPNLIQILERTARQSLLPFLEEGERSVGVEVEIRHLAPVPVGKRVTCATRVIRADGREISFHIEARDEHEVVARGAHKRHVIRVERFAQRVKEKSV
ncbi:MAG TPA: thioesterase family protein [Candidatus Acidoferrum sp.]|nr:thioesterase family protein [Candidatus Acidoferrum sp.]